MTHSDRLLTTSIAAHHGQHATMAPSTRLLAVDSGMKHDIVLAAASSTQPFPVQHADHGERHVADAKDFSYSRTPIEEFFGDNRSHDCDFGSGCDLVACKRSAVGNLPFASHQVVGID